jgi:AraC family transcriptional regulator, positive regulator of tynA and feaB
MKHWNTSQLPEHDRFEYWREVICQSFISLRPERLPHSGGRASPFDCALQSWEARGLLFGKVSGAAQQVYRDAACIQSSDRPVYFLNIQKSGYGEIEQGGVTAALNDASFVVVDATQPFRMKLSEGFEQLSIKIPKHLLQPYLPQRSAATAQRADVSHGVGKLAAIAFESLSSEIDQLDHLSADLAIEQALALTACALNANAPNHGSSSWGEPSRLALLRERAMALITQSLDDPDLDVHGLALALGVSARYVQQAFSSAQLSVGKWILEQRLLRCKQALASPQQMQLTIGKIAFRHGFSDLSHFNRAFKLRFGQAPGEFRRQHNDDARQAFSDS